MAYQVSSDLHSVDASLFTTFDVHENTLDLPVFFFGAEWRWPRPPRHHLWRPNSPNVNWYVRKCPINFFINGYNAFWVSSAGRCASLSKATHTCAARAKKTPKKPNAQTCSKHTGADTQKACGWIMQENNEWHYSMHAHILTTSFTHIQLFIFHRKSITSVVVRVIFNAIIEPSLIQLPGVFTAVWTDTVRLASPSLSHFLLELQTSLSGKWLPPPFMYTSCTVLYTLSGYHEAAVGSIVEMIHLCFKLS